VPLCLIWSSRLIRVWNGCYTYQPSGCNLIPHGLKGGTARIQTPCSRALAIFRRVVINRSLILLLRYTFRNKNAVILDLSKDIQTSAPAILIRGGGKTTTYYNTPRATAFDLSRTFIASCLQRLVGSRNRLVLRTAHRCSGYRIVRSRA
jgi:hypothetical protein